MLKERVCEFLSESACKSVIFKTAVPGCKGMNTTIPHVFTRHIGLSPSMQRAFEGGATDNNQRLIA